MLCFNKNFVDSEYVNTLLHPKKSFGCWLPFATFSVQMIPHCFHIKVILDWQEPSLYYDCKTFTVVPLSLYR